MGEQLQKEKKRTLADPKLVPKLGPKSYGHRIKIRKKVPVHHFIICNPPFCNFN